MGILFTPKLIWTRAKLHSLRRLLFDMMVKPILCYGGEVWGYEYCNQIETVHANFCKTFLGLSRHINNSMALGECGGLPLCSTYYVRCIKYWCRLLHMESHRYPSNAYLMLKQHDDIGRINWATHVKTLLHRYGFGYACVAQDIGDTNMFVAVSAAYSGLP